MKTNKCLEIGTKKFEILWYDFIFCSMQAQSKSEIKVEREALRRGKEIKINENIVCWCFWLFSDT